MPDPSRPGGSEGALDIELDQIAKERRSLGSELAPASPALAAPNIAAAELARAIDQLRGDLPSAPPERRRQVIRALIPGTAEHRIVLSPDLIEATVGLAPGRIAMARHPASQGRGSRAPFWLQKEARATPDDAVVTVRLVA